MKVPAFIITASVTLTLLAPATANAAAAKTPVVNLPTRSKPAVSKHKRHLEVLCRNAPRQKPVSCFDKNGHRRASAKSSPARRADNTRPMTVLPYYVLPRLLSTNVQLCAIWGGDCAVPPADSQTNDETSAVLPATETAVADSASDSSQNTDSLPEVAAVSPSNPAGPQDYDWDC